MRHHNLQVTGSVSVNGISAATAADLATYTGSNDSKVSTLQSFTASISTTNTFTASAILRLNDLETKSASVDTTNITQNNRLTSLEEKTGSLATTGSNTFFGTQVFSGSLYVQDNLIVQGSSSLQNITASAVSIGTNIVNLNTANPAVRYGGISVQDSGSASGVTGSMLWDSTCNRWIYSNPSGVGYSGGIIMSGPRAATLGTETTLTCNYVAKSGGGDHLYDSCIIDDGTTICAKANFIGTGTACFSGQLNTITGVFGNKGGGNYGVLISDNDQSNVRLRFTNSGTGGQSMSIVGGNPAVSNSGLAIYDETAGATRLYINSSGCIGVGLACPTNMLHLIGISSTPSLRLGSASISYYWDIGRENETTGDFVFINAHPTTTYERMRITTSGCVGINTSNPGSLLDVQNCSNNPYNNTNTLTSGQWLRVSNPSACLGATSGILFQAQGPSGGNGLATIHGSVLSCGSMGITFATRHDSGNVTEKMRIVSSGTVTIGTQTATPQPHSGGNSGGLIVQGLNSCRGIIEVWDGTSGKGVFQQVGGTTYVGNLCKGVSGGELYLLVNGDGGSATNAMVLTRCGHIVVNNAANGQADYGRFTISTSTPKTSNPGSQEITPLHLSTCESDTPFGLKIQLIGNTCSCLRYASFQTGDHYISNQGNIVMQLSGGNVAIGTSSPYASARFQIKQDTNINIAFQKGTADSSGIKINSFNDAADTNIPMELNASTLFLKTNESEKMRIDSVGTVKYTGNFSGGNYYMADTTQSMCMLANGQCINFCYMSGMLLVNDWNNGSTTLYLAGGGSTTMVGNAIAQTGCFWYNPAIVGYSWTNTSGLTRCYGFFVVRTRPNA